MAEHDALWVIRAAYQTPPLRSARQRISNATQLDDLERIVEQADRYYLSGHLTRTQTEAVAYAAWAKSKTL
jgi:hypothetical protein